MISRQRVKNNQPGSHDFSWFLSQFSTDFYAITIFQNKLNIPENFVKIGLYSVFKFFDYLTCMPSV